MFSYCAEKLKGPADKNAERYSLLQKLTMTEPDAKTLEIVFNVGALQGAPQLADYTQDPPSKWLQRIIICPCLATEMKVTPSQSQECCGSDVKSGLAYLQTGGCLD